MRLVDYLKCNIFYLFNIIPVLIYGFYNVFASDFNIFTYLQFSHICNNYGRELNLFLKV